MKFSKERVRKIRIGKLLSRDPIGEYNGEYNEEFKKRSGAVSSTGLQSCSVHLK